MNQPLSELITLYSYDLFSRLHVGSPLFHDRWTNNNIKPGVKSHSIFKEENVWNGELLSFATPLEYTKSIQHFGQTRQIFKVNKNAWPKVGKDKEDHFHLN